MRLILISSNSEKSLKYRRKHPYKYLIRKDEAETLMELEKLKQEIGLFPKQIQKRIKSIIENIDKLTVFSG